MIKNFFAVLIFTAFVSSCTYEKAEDLNPVDPADTITTQVCDTLNITYTNTIKPLLIANCSIDNDACHSSNSEYPQDSYENIFIFTPPDRMLSAVTHDGTTEEMPQNAEKLDDCKINKIRAWINQGTLE